MKKTSSEPVQQESADELLPEYDFDYRQAHLNRFVLQPAEKGRMVVLEPEIADVFKTSEAVNSVLRALIRAMPKTA